MNIRIKTAQSMVRTDPDKAVRIFLNAIHHVIRQSVFYRIMRKRLFPFIETIQSHARCKPDIMSGRLINTLYRIKTATFPQRQRQLLQSFCRNLEQLKAVFSSNPKPVGTIPI